MLIFFDHAQASAVEVIIDMSPVDIVTFLQLFPGSKGWHFYVAWLYQRLKIANKIRS
jgi:hypothetical protein